jgi:hypothetical protein
LHLNAFLMTVGHHESAWRFPPLLPSGLEEFVDHVVPILQRRGLFRTRYSGTTLRDHYGLPRPANRFATAEVTGWAVTGRRG